MTITIVGLGPGDKSYLTLGALDALRSGRHVLLRTTMHPIVDDLRDMGITFDSCDDLYEKANTFEDVYREIVDRVLSYDDVVYAVPGHPLLGEQSVKLIKEKTMVEVVPGTSFLDALFITLGLDPVNGLQLCDALQLHQRAPSGHIPAIIMQLHSQAVASEVKLSLMERYPDQHAVVLVRAAGIRDKERVLKLPLYELDHHDWIDYLTTLYIPPLKESKIGDTNPRTWIPIHWALDPLVEVMAYLRSETGCPWDREQTHRTLRRYMLEEAYEIVEAIDAEDMQSLCEELGDVLLQVVFHAQIARERGEFDMAEVIQGITEKLIRRHPHVFGDVKVTSSADVVQNWKTIKEREKGQVPIPFSLRKTSAAYPSLTRAVGIQQEAAKFGFDWDDIQGPAEKIKEELDEVLTASSERVENEVGDLLFSVVNLSRKMNVEPEIALASATKKFVSRFECIMGMAIEQGRELKGMALHELEILWGEAKRKESNEKFRSKK